MIRLFPLHLPLYLFLVLKSFEDYRIYKEIGNGNGCFLRGARIPYFGKRWLSYGWKGNETLGGGNIVDGMIGVLGFSLRPITAFLPTLQSYTIDMGNNGVLSCGRVNVFNLPFLSSHSH